MLINFYSFDYLRAYIYIANNLEGHILRHRCIYSPPPIRQTACLSMPGLRGCRVASAMGWGRSGQSAAPSPAPHPAQTRKPVNTNQPHLARAESNFPGPSSDHRSAAFPAGVQQVPPPGTGKAGNPLRISRLNAFPENSHPEALACKLYLSVLVLHFIRTYFHHQLFGGGEAVVTSQ